MCPSRMHSIRNGFSERITRRAVVETEPPDPHAVSADVPDADETSIDGGLVRVNARLVAVAEVRLHYLLSPTVGFPNIKAPLP